jgi:hypothetical protein
LGLRLGENDLALGGTLFGELPRLTIRRIKLGKVMKADAEAVAF